MSTKGVSLCCQSSSTSLVKGALLPLVPGSEDLAEKLFPVVWVIGSFIVLRQGNACSNTVRVAADHVIGRVAVGVDAGICPYLEGVLSPAGQLHYRSGAVGAAFPCLPGCTGGNAAVSNRKAAVRSYDCIVADLAGTLRALDECHMNYAPVCKNGYKKYTCTDGCIDGIMTLVEGYYTGFRPYSVLAVPVAAGAVCCA